MKVDLFIPWGGFEDERIHARNLVLRYVLDQHAPWWRGFAFDGVTEDFRRSRACNIAAYSSAADVVVFLDADTIIDPEQLREAVRIAHRTKGAVRAYTRYRRLDEASSAALTDWREAFGGQVYWEQETAPSHGAFAVHRQTFCELGGYDPRFVYFYDDLSFDIRAGHVHQERVPGDLYHLWHPAREVPDSDEALWRRYEHEDPELVRAEAGFPV